MKTRFVAAVISLVIAISGLATAQSQPSSNFKTFTGTVSDNMCGAKHMVKDKSAAECTRECVKMGSDYALVVGNTVYTLKGDKTAIDTFAGESATVTGKMSGSTIAVDSITSAKAPTK